MNPLVIEFAGLPGAGKSAVAQALVPRLQLNGVQRVQHYQLSASLAKGGARWAWVGKKLVDAGQFISTSGVLRGCVTTEKLVLIRWLYNSAARARRVSHHGSVDHPDVIVLDEGPLHLLWSACFGAYCPDGAVCERALRVFYELMLPRAHVCLVYVEVSNHTAALRFVERGGVRSRFHRAASRSARSTFLKDANYPLLIDTMKRIETVRMIQVSGEEPIDRVASRVVEDISETPAWVSVVSRSEGGHAPGRRAK